MEYRQAVDYILSFADFERSGRFQDRPDVAPMLSLLGRLGEPHLGRRTVHIVGSKGKGSTAAMVESVLRAAGLKSGLYTSPHLHSYCERIRLGAEPIAEERFGRLTALLRPAVEAEQVAQRERQLVTFDLLTALAFLAFREEGVEVQVLEAGLGGRVDSTNVFRHKEVCVVTPISLEHAAILGNTMEEIAREKAAVIRPGSVVVLAPQAYEGSSRVVRQAAVAAGAALVEVAQGYRWRRLHHDLRGQVFELEGPGGVLRARLPLLGAHQMENAATALACLDALRERGCVIPQEAVLQGLAAVSWPGRLEVLWEKPLIIADGAHNQDSAWRFREALEEYFSCQQAVLVVGVSSDKDVGSLAYELAPVARRVVATRSGHPRAMPPEQVAEAFARLGVRAEVAESPGRALERAMAAEGEGGVICLVGSLFLVAEGRRWLVGALAG